MLGPTLDLPRTPLHGRTFESFGEDPYLMGQIAVPEVRAIQEHDAQADANHFAGNNIERLRRVLDVQIDERVAHELYLPYYEDVIRRGGLHSMMCAFNKFNGVFACDDDVLLNELLRDRWGFKGWVRNDHTAYHHVESAENGLDLELPTAWVFDDNLVAAVRDGRVDEGTVDRSVHRLLRAMFASGTFDDPPERVGVPVDEHAEVARELAEDGTVLLKNDGGTLPLEPAAVDAIAVIGSDADTTATYRGGSTNIAPATKDTILDVIAADFDGDGRTLSARALSDEGYSPGATVTAGGATFTWPDTVPGEPDNVATAGQAIWLHGSGRTLSLLATSTAGLPTSGDRTAGRVNVVYADGGTEHFTVDVTDWRTSSPAAGSETAVTLPYFN